MFFRNYGLLQNDQLLCYVPAFVHFPVGNLNLIREALQTSPDCTTSWSQVHHNPPPLTGRDPGPSCRSEVVEPADRAWKRKSFQISRSICIYIYVHVYL